MKQWLIEGLQGVWWGILDWLQGIGLLYDPDSLLTRWQRFMNWTEPLRIGIYVMLGIAAAMYGFWYVFVKGTLMGG